MGKRKRKQTQGHDFRGNRSQQQHGQSQGSTKGSLIFSRNTSGVEAFLEDKEGPSQRMLNGQKEAFPGLGDNSCDSDGDFLGPANDGLEYLRMVRSEAKGVPHLLLANPPRIPILPPPDPRLLSRPIPTKKELDVLCYDDVEEEEEEEETAPDKNESVSTGDYEEHETNGSAQLKEGCFYSDGAYVAAAGSSSRLLPVQPTHPSLLQLPPRPVSREWHDSIIHQFRSTRERWRTNPPVSPAAALPMLRTWPQWMEFMRHTPVSPANAVALSSSDAIQGIRRVTRMFRNRSQIDERVGRWLWALLLRCDEPGILRNEEIGIIRDLGKRASWLLGGWAIVRKADLHTDEEDDIDGGDGGDDEEREWWTANDLPELDENSQDGLDEDENPEKYDDRMSDAGGDEEIRDSLEPPPPIKIKPSTVSPLMLRPRSVKVAKSTPVTAKINESTAAEKLWTKEPAEKEEHCDDNDVSLVDDDTVAQNIVSSIKTHITSENITEDNATGLSAAEPQAIINEEAADTTSAPADLAESDNAVEAEEQAGVAAIVETTSEQVIASVQEDSEENAIDKLSKTDNDGSSSSIRASQSSKLAQKPTLQTLFTLDMVLSVVGDYFGQKDLLLERR